MSILYQCLYHIPKTYSYHFSNKLKVRIFNEMLFTLKSTGLLRHMGVGASQRALPQIMFRKRPVSILTFVSQPTCLIAPYSLLLVTGNINILEINCNTTKVGLVCSVKFSVLNGRINETCLLLHQKWSSAFTDNLTLEIAHHLLHKHMTLDVMKYPYNLLTKGIQYHKQQINKDPLTQCSDKVPVLYKRIDQFVEESTAVLLQDMYKYNGMERKVKLSYKHQSHQHFIDKYQNNNICITFDRKILQ